MQLLFFDFQKTIGLIKLPGKVIRGYKDSDFSDFLDELIFYLESIE